MMAKKKLNQPLLKKSPSFLPLTIPISSKNIAKKPLKISVVKGLIPKAALSLASKPIIKLPIINNTLPFVNECLITSDNLDGCSVALFLLYILIKITPTIIAGASISAITATICPLKL